MPISFKKRFKIIQDEILDQKGNRIYVEKKIKNIIKNRYPNNEIKLDSSYIYQKMTDLLDKKIYLEVRGMSKGGFVKSLGFINVFELHEKLDKVIQQYHLSNIKSKVYTKEEKQYMKHIFKI